MNINVKNIGAISVVELEGRIDSSVSPEVESRLLQLVQEGRKFLVLDFKAVEYMASAGMRILLVLAKRVKELEGLICLASVTGGVGDILSVVGFVPHFDIYETVDQAIDAMGE